jgi:hypothetical protein
MAGGATPTGSAGAPPPTEDTTTEEEDEGEAPKLATKAEQDRERVEYRAHANSHELNRLEELKNKAAPFIEDTGVISDMDRCIGEISEYHYYAKFLQRTLKIIQTNSGFYLIPPEGQSGGGLNAFKASLGHARHVLELSGSVQNEIDEIATQRQAMEIVKEMIRKIREKKEKAEKEFFNRIDAAMVRKIDRIEEDAKKDPNKAEAAEKMARAMKDTIVLLQRLSGRSKAQRIRELNENENTRKYMSLIEPSEYINEVEEKAASSQSVKETLIELKAYLLARGIKAGDVGKLKQMISDVLHKNHDTETDENRKSKMMDAIRTLDHNDESTYKMAGFIKSNWYLISPGKKNADGNLVLEVDMTEEERSNLEEEPDHMEDINMRISMMNLTEAGRRNAEDIAADMEAGKELTPEKLQAEYDKVKKEKEEKVDSIAGKIASEATRLMGRMDSELIPLINAQFAGEDKKNLREDHLAAVTGSKEKLKGWTDIAGVYNKVLDGDGKFDIGSLIDKDGNISLGESKDKVGVLQYMAIASHPKASASTKQAAMLTAMDMLGHLRQTIKSPQEVLDVNLKEYDMEIDRYKTHMVNKTKQGEQWQIYFLSFQDFKHMGEKLVEWAKRRYTRRSDKYMGDFGTKLFKDLPGPLATVSNEFERVKEHSEIEEVEQYEKAYTNKDAWMITAIMETTTNQDEFKACIKLLCHHGRMRWDNPKLWHQLMVFTHGSIQFNTKDPEAEIESGNMLQEKIAKSCGIIWDYDTYEHWLQENTSKYTSQMQNYKSYADQTAESPGNIDAAMATMLSAFKEEKRHGHIPKVDPHKYEELIHYGIEYGKGSPEGKLYFLIQGMACGLLSPDAASRLNSNWINNYPVIDILGTSTDRGNKPTLRDIREWARLDWDLNKPGAAFHKWWYTDVLHRPRVYQRVSKALVQGISQDHDDATGWFGAADVNVIEQCLSQNSQGFRMPPTGVQNASIGMLHYLDNMMEFGEEDMGLSGETGVNEQFSRLIGAFCVYDGITTSRMYQGSNQYFRWKGEEERVPRSVGNYDDSYGRGAVNLGGDKSREKEEGAKHFTVGNKTKDFIKTMKEYTSMLDEDFFNFLYNSMEAKPADVQEQVAKMEKKYGIPNIFGPKRPTDTTTLHQSVNYFIRNILQTKEGKENFARMRNAIRANHRWLEGEAGLEKNGRTVRGRLAFIKHHQAELDAEIRGEAHGHGGHHGGGGEEHAEGQAGMPGGGSGH